MENFVGLVGSLGFPIAMCIYMVYNQERTHRRHIEETAKLTELISNNTVALTRLAERLERYEMIPDGAAADALEPKSRGDTK